MAAPPLASRRFRPSSFWLIMLSTLVSGVAALLYQIAWVRVLVPIIGLDFFAVSAVATGSLLGLAIGSFAFGLLSDRVRNKLAIYLALEILIPLSSLCLLGAVRVLTPDINLALRMSEDSIVTMLLQFLFGGVVVLIPSLFMGGTLPALIGLFYAGKAEGGSNDVSLIYAVNTAGSAVAALLLSWLLIGWIGVTGTFIVGGILNLASAVLVAALFFSGYSLAVTPRGGERDRAAVPTAGLSNTVRAHLLACYLIVGFVGLGFQQVVYRLTTFIWGAATAQYSFVVGMFLIGLVAGAILVNRASPKSRRFGPNLASIEWLTLASAVTIIASIFVFAIAHRYLMQTEFLLIKAANKGIAAEFPFLSAQIAGFVMVGALAISLPMMFSGAIYPIVNHLLAQSSQRVGLWTGLTLLAGIFGSLLGSLVTTYGLLPWLGFPATIALLAAMIVMAGRLANRPIAASSNQGSEPARPFFRAASSLALLGLIALSALLPNATAVSLLSGEQVASIRPGITGFSHLSRPSDRSSTEVYINGKVQGRIELGGSNQTRVMLAKSVMPDARRILLIGIGDGQILYYLSHYFPEAKITVVELNREIAPLLLGDERFSWMRDGFKQQFNLVYEDGRFFLKQNPTQYDLIVTMALRSGDDYSSFLYSQEFLGLVSARLTDKGYFVGMFSPYTPTMIKMIASTFAGAFSKVAQAERAGLIAGTNAADAASVIGSLPSPAYADRVCDQSLPQGLAALPLDRCRTAINSLKWLDASALQAPPILDDRPRNEFYFLQ